MSGGCKVASTIRGSRSMRGNIARRPVARLAGGLSERGVLDGSGAFEQKKRTGAGVAQW